MIVFGRLPISFGWAGREREVLTAVAVRRAPDESVPDGSAPATRPI